MTEEQLEKAKKIQGDLKLAKEALEITKTNSETDLIFMAKGARYDMKMNRVFYRSVYSDLRKHIQTYCEIKLTILIENWNKELEGI